MIEKKEIDNWFSTNYKKIDSIIIYWRNYHNKKFDKGDMMNDVYLYVISNNVEYKDISHFESVVFNYIKQHSYWSMSKINKDYKTNKEYTSRCEFEVENIEEEETNEDKKLLEVRINGLFKFRDSIEDITEKIYFTRWLDLLLDGDNPSIRRMRDEFNIKLYQASELNKDLLNRLNEFLLKNNYKYTSTDMPKGYTPWYKK